MLNIIELIDKQLEREDRARSSHYASQLSIKLPTGVEGKCLRALYYAWSMIPKSNPVTAAKKWKFEMGNLVHDFVYEKLQKSNISIVNEKTAELGFKHQEKSLQYPIAGRPDNIIIDSDRGLRIGVEVKSRYGKGYTQAKSGDFRASDVLQVLAYLYTKQAEEYILLITDFNSGWRDMSLIELKEDFVVVNKKEYPQINWRGVIERLYELEQYLLNKTVPPRDFIKSNWRCTYCEFLNYCWRENDTTV